MRDGNDTSPPTRDSRGRAPGTRPSRLTWHTTIMITLTYHRTVPQDGDPERREHGDSGFGWTATEPKVIHPYAIKEKYSNTFISCLQTGRDSNAIIRVSTGRRVDYVYLRM